MENIYFEEGLFSIPEKTKELVTDCISKFNESFSNDEDAVRAVFSLPCDSEGVVLARVVVLNQLYSTRLNSNPPKNSNNSEQKVACDVRLMAKLLYESQFEGNTDFSKIQKKEDVKLVKNWIENMSAELQKKGKSRSYSFLTKYCSWHFATSKENTFSIPIYDSYVGEMIYRIYKDKEIEYDKNITRSSLEDYSVFFEVVEHFRTTLNVFTGENYNSKQIDQFLWYYGKNRL